MDNEFISLDVREDIRSGREPFSKIMNAVAALEPNQKLLLIAPFDLTAQGCPMHESIRFGALNVLLNSPGLEDAEVELVWDPPWHPSMMTEVGRAATGVTDF